MKRLAVLLALLAPSAAFAMPALVATAIAYFAGTVVTTAITVLSYAIVIGASALYSNYQRRKAESRARSAYNASLKDRTLMVRSTTEPRDLVLGRVRKSGPLVFIGTTGQHKEKLVMVIALAAHRCSAIEQVYFNDQPVALDANGYVTSEPYTRPRRVSVHAYLQLDANGSGVVNAPGPVAQGSTWAQGSYGNYTIAMPDGNVIYVGGAPFDSVTVYYQYDAYEPKARVWWYLGDDNQPADARLKQLFPDKWTDNHRLRGVTYLVAELDYNEDAFPSSVPNISAVVRGALVYDPRDGQTKWSQNPALLARHYAYHPLGAGLPAGSVSDSHVIAAANACDQSYTFTIWPGSPISWTFTRALYQANTVAKAGAKPSEVLQELAEAMAGKVGYQGNQLILRAGAYTAPVMALDDNDFSDASAIEIAPHRPRDQVINRVTGTFADEGNNWQVVDFPAVQFDDYIAQDGRELPIEVELGAVTHVAQAQHVCRVMLRDARQSLIVKASFKLKAYPLQLFDVVTITCARYGWVAKPFEVLGRRWVLGSIELTLKETDPSIYSFDPNFSGINAAPNTTLPKPWEVADVGPLVVESGTSWLVRQSDGTVLTRVRVTWPAIQDAPVQNGGVIEVAYTPADSPADDGKWPFVQVPGDSTEAFITGLEDGRVYLIKARARSSIAAGQWSVQVSHRVVGKTAAPTDVPWALISGTRVTWGGVSDIDLAGYRLRYVAGAQVNWAAGQPLHEGLLTVTTFDLVTRPSGVVTILVKAVDTSGNESENPAYIVTDLGDPEVLNVLESWPQAPTWPGEIVGGAVSAGVLEANETTQFWGQGTGLHWGAGGSPYWPVAAYEELRYTCWFVTTSTGTLSLESEAEGSDVRIEYYREAQTAFWPLDDDNFWPADDAFFWAQGPGWLPWPGNVLLTGGEPIGMRLIAAAGQQRGRVIAFTPHLDVPDIEERLDDVPIAAGGSRLPVTAPFRVIKNIQLTIQSDGGGGTSARIVDKQVSPGPLVQVLNDAGASVAGIVDARVKGY